MTTEFPEPTTDRALALEATAAQALMAAAEVLVGLQGGTQPDAVPELRAALAGAAEIEIQLRFGPHPHLRLVTIGADGGEDVLLRRLDLALPTRAAH